MAQKKYTLSQAKKRLAKQGRYGDTHLEHVNSAERYMLKKMGASRTTNPKTGLTENNPFASIVETVQKVIPKQWYTPPKKIVIPTPAPLPTPNLDQNLGKSAKEKWKKLREQGNTAQNLAEKNWQGGVNAMKHNMQAGEANYEQMKTDYGGGAWERNLNRGLTTSIAGAGDFLTSGYRSGMKLGYNVLGGEGDPYAEGGIWGPEPSTSGSTYSTGTSSGSSSGGFGATKRKRKRKRQYTDEGTKSSDYLMAGKRSARNPGRRGLASPLKSGLGLPTRQGLAIS